MFEKIEQEYPRAKGNYQLAQSAFHYVLSVIKGSSTRLSKAEQEIDKDDIIKRIGLMRVEEDAIQEREYSCEWIRNVATLALKYQVGNCYENACTFFDYINRNASSNDVNLELFNDPFSDHFFVVLGREPNTEAIDPRTWNADAIVCDPWGEERSYFIGEVDFQDLARNRRKVIRYLTASGSLTLALDVLGNANGNKESMIVNQSCLVLRTQYYHQQTTIYNLHVPMVYEDWDLPQEKHYKKHQKQLRHSFFATKAPLPDDFVTQTIPDEAKKIFEQV